MIKVSISVIIPVYNEENYINEIIKKVNEVKIKKEIIVINDGSTDCTKKKLKKIRINNLKIINNKVNKGKGHAIRCALKYVKNDIVIIQDADLEYNPSDYIKLIKPFMKKKVSVVYGSRFLEKKVFGIEKGLNHNYRYIINRFLTLIFNILNKQKLTDAHTCYKVFRSKIIKKLNLVEKGFSFCPEFSTKVVKLGYKIYEVPISYTPRSKLEGKKISYKDGFHAIRALIKFRFFR
tara:strand:- start:1180 stop:1884 length:705 start_codon:yes stop_codon:yes gene_type:complete